MAGDRPDLVARVFHLYLREFLDDLTKRHVLGRAIGWTYVDKPRTVADIDRVISAELPDPDTQPELFRLVTSHMLHGPCGAFNTSAPCMTDGSCTKHYRKDFRNATAWDVDGYP
eukprot:gene28982-37925_t